MISYLAGNLSLPGGLWSSLINWFHSGIGNFGWTIFLLTIVIKLITSPLDFWTKLNTKKQSLIQQKCAPQVAKIKKKFGENQQAARVQTNALYKREGLNSGVGCVVTMLHLVLSLVIFFTFYSSLRANSAYQAINQYEILVSTYDDKAYEVLLSRDGDIEEYTLSNEDQKIAKANADSFTLKYAHGRNLVTAQTEQTQTDEEIVEDENPLMTNEEYINFYEKYYDILEEISNKYSKEENFPNNENVYSFLISKNSDIEDYDITNNETAENFVNIYTKAKPVFNKKCIELYNKYKELMTDVQETAENAILKKWDTIKSDWLWISNIWVADSPTKPFLTYQGLVQIANSGGKVYKDYVAENVNANSFTFISDIVNTKGSRTKNGYYILAILAAGATYLAQVIAESHTKLKNKKAKEVAGASMSESLNYSMKMMKFIMPIIMIAFVLKSSASFGIYIVASNIITILTGEAINAIVNKITNKKQKEVESFLEKEANRLIKKGKLQEKK